MSCREAGLAGAVKRFGRRRFDHLRVVAGDHGDRLDFETNLEGLDALAEGVALVEALVASLLQRGLALVAFGLVVEERIDGHDDLVALVEEGIDFPLRLRHLLRHLLHSSVST